MWLLLPLATTNLSPLSLNLDPLSIPVFWRWAAGVLALPPFTSRLCWPVVGCRSPGRGGGEARRTVDRRGYKSSERGVTASFLFLPIPRWKSRYPKLALGRGWIRQGTKAVIGSLSMINPTLIRKNPRVLCLFAAGQTGQRALSPTLERSCECVCV